MDKFVHPALFFILGAFLIPVFKGRLKQIYLLLIPAAAFYTVLTMNLGVYGEVNYLGFKIILGRVDRLTIVFAHVFTLMSFLGVLYGIHVKEDAQHIASYFYVGGSLGVVFAGDYLTRLYLLGDDGLGLRLFDLVPPRAGVTFGRVPLSVDAHLRRFAPFGRHLFTLPEYRQYGL